MNKGTRVRITGQYSPHKGREGVYEGPCEFDCGYYIRLDGNKYRDHFNEGEFESLVEDDDPSVPFALAGLEQRVRDQLTQLDALQARLTALQQDVVDTSVATRETSQLVRQTREALSDKLPPFEVGQRVRTPNKGIITVDAIDRAFNQWVVLGHFGVPGSKQYTYPASELEAA